VCRHVTGRSWLWSGREEVVVVVSRVFLVDDHEVVRVGIRELLSASPDLEVVGEAAS
jgi:hypothetical protein